MMEQESSFANIDLSMLLSCQRTIESLNKAMADVIREVFGPLNYRFYLHTLSTLADSYFLYSNSPHSFDVNRDIMRLTSADGGDCSFDADGLNYYPAVAGDKVVAFIVAPESIPVDDERQLTCLLAIYCNVLCLISESKVDGLTGLGNRKSFDQNLVQEIESICRTEHRRESDRGEPNQSYLAILDIDHFKRVNDLYGHLIGDEVLLTLAQKIKKCFREDDGLYRYGGEEFAVILRHLEQDAAERVLNRFVAQVRESVFPAIEHITISVGFCLLDCGDAPSQVITCADKALYYSKQNGRDRVSNYHQLRETGVIQEKTVETDIELF